MDMIEKVARAIATAREQNGAAPFDAYDAKYARPALFDEARAAIAAMSEPTPEQIEAATDAIIDAGAFSEKDIDSEGEPCREHLRTVATNALKAAAAAR